MAPAQALHALNDPLTDAQIEGDQKLHLQDLQGNILKGHGRNHSAHVFITFKTGKAAAVKAWMKKAVNEHRFTNAYQQLKAAAEFKQTGKDGGVFQIFFISAKGYTYLGQDVAKFDTTFKNGLRGSIAALNDPLVNDWDAELKHEFHAMLLIADVRQANVHFMAKELQIELALLADTQIVFGDQQKNERGDGIEHFGYVDGRSQPLMLEEEIAGESDGTSLWDPAVGPKLVLVADPLGKPKSSGSYFVFRKLEEKVKAFKTQEQTLATQLGLTGEAKELAGAYVIGRFEDGTPVTLFDEPMIETSAELNGGTAPNNFDYRADLDGSKCPFHSHIRKSNPRGSGPGGLADENSRRMARRGITYGQRTDDFMDINTMPEGGVGLLFMAYQRSIADQFEFIQKSWVNNDSFPKSGVGIDPVLGQNPVQTAQKWPKVWGDATQTVSFNFRDFVKMRGGEYFFAPSLSSLTKF